LRTSAEYLGTMATIADAEALGVSLAWETCDVLALDSKEVIQRIQGLAHQTPRCEADAVIHGIMSFNCLC